MNFQPIIVRELTRATRHPRLWVIRILAPMMILAAFYSAFTMQIASGANNPMGRVVFAAMFAVAALAFIVGGLIQTVDCLARERREGTLGLLLLTRVTVFDVVIGKVCGRTLVLWQGLLAAAPILSLAILFGAVGPTDLGNAVLHLASVLFVSVSLCLLVSACCRDEGQATVVAIVVLGSYALLPLWVDFLFAANILSQLSLIHPVLGLFHENFRTAILRPLPNRWVASALHIGVGLLGLLLTCWRIRRSAEILPPVRSEPGRKTMRFVDFAGWLPRLRRSRLTTDENPVALLAVACWRQINLMRNVGFGAGLAILFGLRAMGLKPADITGSHLNPFGFERVPLQLVIMLFLWRLLALARHERLFELMACTPLGSEEFLRGYWGVLRKLFLWPLGLLVVAQLLHHSTGGFGLFGFILLTFYLVVDSAVEFLYLGWIGLVVALGPDQRGARMTFAVWLVVTGLLELFAPWVLIIQVAAIMFALQTVPGNLTGWICRVDYGAKKANDSTG